MNRTGHAEGRTGGHGRQAGLRKDHPLRDCNAAVVGLSIGPSAAGLTTSHHPTGLPSMEGPIPDLPTQAVAAITPPGHRVWRDQYRTYPPPGPS